MNTIAWEIWLPPILGSLLALVSLWLSLRASKRRRLVDDIPTSKTSGIFIGFVEVKGSAETGAPLVSFLAACRCVHYTWQVEEHWSRTVTETYTDSSGKTRTRTRHESGWKTVANGGETIPFYLKDDHGSVLVRPEGAKIEAPRVFSQTCNQWDPLYYGKGPAWAVANSDHRRRFTEEAVVLHAPLYIMGQARERQDVVAPEIAADPAAPMFLISTRSEEQVSSGLKWSSRGWFVLGLVLCGGGMAFLGKMMQPAMPIIITVLVYLMMGIVGWIWMTFNSLVHLRQRMRQAWAQVDVQLKRRHDLIPNVIAVVAGLRDHEESVQKELAGLRAQMNATPPGEAGTDYEAVGRKLIAITEAYPQLTAQESFLRLQKELADTETRIALARGYFNEIATQFNTRLEIIPDRFVGQVAGMKPQTLMAANDFQRVPVEVQFEQ